jgi:photosystem II stability/assembly factor-like uncharacterized protein
MSATFGWAVGHSGKIRRYNGSSWEAAIPAPTGSELLDVAIVAETDVWAVGTGGVILHHTSADPNNWQPVPIGSNEILVSISIPAANAGWIGGLDSALLQYDGNTWTNRNREVKPEALTSDILLGVDVLPNGNVWAVGGDLDNDSIILKREGSSWQADTNPTTLTLLDIDMSSDSEGWAVGGNFNSSGGVILKRTGGMWQVDATNPTTRTLTGIDIVSNSEVWAVGGDFENRRGGTNLATIVQYNGANWLTDSVPADAGVLYDLDMFNASTGFAVGEQNTILRYQGAGSWVKETLNSGGGTYQLAAVQMVSATEAWAVGVNESNTSLDSGLILHYQNNTWQPVTVSNTLLEGIELLDISMLSTSEGWAVGDNGVTLYYQNGTWQQINQFNSLYLFGVHLLNSTTGWIVGAGGAILQAGPINTNPKTYLPIVQRQPSPTPVPTLTSTPTLTPSPTPTPQPTPLVLYDHNFSNGAGDWLRGSTRGEDGGDCDSRHSNNRYILDIDFDSRYRCIRPAPERANYRYGTFETEAERTSGSNRVDYGLYINGSGGGEYYLFIVSPNNPCGWTFVKRQDGRDDDKRYGGCDNISSGTNRLRIQHLREGNNDRFTFFINGQEVGNYREPHNSTLNGEGTGVYAEARDDGDAEIRYSYFTVLSPP